MNCAECQTPLQSTDFKGIVIYECSKCQGRWFARDELKKAKDHTDEDLSWIDFDPFSDEADKYTVQSEHKECPKCLVPMASLTYEKSRVIIDRCMNCHGIWLHRDEFPKIIKYLGKLITNESSAELARESLKQFLKITKGEKGISSEIKDFLTILKLLRRRISVEHPDMIKTVDKIYEYLPFL